VRGPSPSWCPPPDEVDDGLRPLLASRLAPPPPLDSDPLRPLLGRGLLREVPLGGAGDVDDAHSGIRQVRGLLAEGGAEVLRAYSVVNPALSSVYEAVKGVAEGGKELDLWHGTTAESLGNIVVNGFNRAYVGRHGTKFGLGTYFSVDADYSLRFCGRRAAGAPRFLLLARVLVGRSAKGTPDLVEPPCYGEGHLERYDSTVDNVQNPSIYCVFRDFQAVPCYVVEVA